MRSCFLINLIKCIRRSQAILTNTARICHNHHKFSNLSTTMFLRQILRRWHCHSSSPLLRLLFPFTFTCSRTGLANFFQSHLPNQLQNICVLYLSEKTDVKTESCWTLLRDFWRFCTLQHCEESTLRHPSQGRRSSRPSAWRSPGCRSASFIWDPKRKLIYHWMLSSFLMAPKLTWHHIYQIIADFFLGSSYRRMCIVCIMVSLVSSWSIAMIFVTIFIDTSLYDDPNV